MNDSLKQDKPLELSSLAAGSRNGVLDTIVLHKRQELLLRQQQQSLESLKKKVLPCEPSQRLERVLQQRAKEDLNFILEIKPSSPSAGVLQKKPDISAIVNAYNEVCIGISVLTDQHYFGGSLALLASVVAQTTHPVLCKDFILEPYQLYEARLSGASIALLIVKSLTQSELELLTHVCRELGMTPLIEVQTEEEVKRALAVDPTVLLINNRNLQTLDMDMNTTQRLAPLIPDSVYKISASGMSTFEDVQALQPYCDGFLIGSSLMKEPAHLLRGKLRALMGKPDALAVVNEMTLSKPQIKICGITNFADAKAALASGATMLGFIFVSKSPRSVTAVVAASIIAALRAENLERSFKAVGVFQNHSLQAIETVLSQCPLDLIQLHGEESATFCTQLGRPVLRVITLHPHLEEAQWIESLHHSIKPYRPFEAYGIVAFLIDLPKAVFGQKPAVGGKGQAIHSGLSTGQHAAIQSFCCSYPVILAGRLSPDNASGLVYDFNPLGVDVASGVEQKPGQKDVKQMQAFCHTVKTAFAGVEQTV